MLLKKRSCLERALLELTHVAIRVARSDTFGQVMSVGRHPKKFARLSKPIFNLFTFCM